MINSDLFLSYPLFENDQQIPAVVQRVKQNNTKIFIKTIRQEEKKIILTDKLTHKKQPKAK
jgi:hypothetical protein